MIKVCEAWSLEDLVDMRDADMEALLGFYEPGTVPSLRDLRFEKELELTPFDGSFGFYV
jgi:precorrin-2 dehydrogenase/sirohydrochlorin ferrochelatase